MPADRHDPAASRQFALLRRWSRLLDSAFRIPGTDIRFGWDPIVGLIPGLGDMSSPIFTALLLTQALRMRVPRVVMARMLFNAAGDAVLGLVPVLGNIVDLAWKANTRNMALLERHAEPGVPPRRSDVLVAYGLLILLVFVAIAPVVLVLWLIVQLSS